MARFRRRTRMTRRPRRRTRRTTKAKSTRKIVKRTMKSMGAVTYDTTFLCATDPITSDNYANFPVLISNMSQSANLPRGFYVDLSRTLNTSQDTGKTSGVGERYTRALNQLSQSATVSVNARCSAIMEGAKYYHNWIKWNFYIQNVDTTYGMRVKLYILKCKTTDVDVPKFFQGVGPPTLPQWATKLYEREYILSPKPTATGGGGPTAYVKKVSGFIRLNKEIRSTRSSYQTTASGEISTDREPVQKGHIYMLVGYSVLNAGGATITQTLALHANGYIRSRFTDSI
jgi:hypothetical protein